MSRWSLQATLLIAVRLAAIVAQKIPSSSALKSYKHKVLSESNAAFGLLEFAVD